MVSYERVVQILQDYINNQTDQIECSWVYEELVERCDVSDEELEDLGLGYLVDSKMEYDTEPAWNLDLGFDPYMGCYTDDC